MTQSTITSQVTPAQPESTALPVLALLSLATTGFISILSETAPAGLLPLVSQSLGISEAMAGQLVSSYAFGSLLAAIPLTIATAHWPRRRVLLLTVAGFIAFNTITALSTNYVLILVARLFAGAAAGLAWSLIPGYARRLVAPGQRGRAMAIAMVGTPIALALGVPLGSFMGNLLGWRFTFGVMSGLSVLLFFWILAVVPTFPGQAVTSRMPIRKVLTTPGVRPILVIALMWMLAHNVLYTYIAPFITPFGMGQHVDVVLLTFGAAAIVGIIATGKLVDRHLRVTVLGSLFVFGAAALVLGLLANHAAAVYAGVAAWGVTFGGAATLLQTALADAAGDGAEVALSMSVVTWNAAIALGGVLGGILLGSVGAGILPWVMLFLVVVALLTAVCTKMLGTKVRVS